MRYVYSSWWNRKWIDAIRKRFADRQDIGRERVYERYFAEEGFAKKEVFEFFDLVESEYGGIAGLLRPDDSLEKLFRKVPTKNPLHWGEYEIMAGDRELWFGDQLIKKMRKHGTYTAKQLPQMETIGDFVRAWCGRLPA
jgi:hypothetical protein